MREGEVKNTDGESMEDVLNLRLL